MLTTDKQDTAKSRTPAPGWMKSVDKQVKHFSI